MKYSYLTLAVLIALAYLLAGCGEDGGGIVVVTPRVTQTYPEDGAVGVDLFLTISVWFSRDMEETSLDSVHILEIPVAQREYDSGEKKLTLNPGGMLDQDSTYHVRVSSFCMDKNGNIKMGTYLHNIFKGCDIIG